MFTERLILSRRSSVVLVLQLIIFAALAAVVLFQLYAVLGRRVGRGPEDAKVDAARAPALEARKDGEAEGPLTGVALLKSREPGFDVQGFLNGARQAYEMIVRAYAGGDRAALKPLLASGVYDAFDAGITEKEAAGRTEEVEFVQQPRADLESADVDNGLARVVVRFLAEFRSRTKDAAGEAVDDRRTAEHWTFERRIGSTDPNWVLARVDPAEA